MKKLLISLAILLATITGQPIQAQEQTIEVLPTMTTESSAQNRIWVGTFQIVWNELTDNIVKRTIKFADFNSKMANNLNKREFKKSDISNNSYYTKSGSISPKLREEIENSIKEKFNETSDILHLIDWTPNPSKILVYAMLKKDFRFIEAFDKLTPQTFGNNKKTAVNYFGIDENSDPKLYKNVEIMFYNSNNDFAVKLFTKENDIVMLYRTNDDKTFDKYYTDLRRKSQFNFKTREFKQDDKLRIPDINLYQQTSFSELENHPIKGSDFVIGDTIETIDFKMNNEGVELKSVISP